MPKIIFFPGEKVVFFCLNRLDLPQGWIISMCILKGIIVISRQQSTECHRSDWVGLSCANK